MIATYAPRVAAHPTRTGVKRDVGIIRLLVVHTSEGGEGDLSAEGLARFIATPRTATNLASYHYIADHDRVIPIVPDDHVAYANAGANHDGLSICHPGKAAQTAAQWGDESSRAQLEQVARWLADKAAEYHIPLVKITATELVTGDRGVCGHVDVTKAYKRSTHTDPGPDYPWLQVIARARQLAQPQPDPDGDDELNQDQANQLQGAFVAADKALQIVTGQVLPALAALTAEVAAVKADVAALPALPAEGEYLSEPQRNQLQAAYAAADKTWQVVQQTATESVTG